MISFFILYLNANFVCWEVVLLLEIADISLLNKHASIKT